jgi:thymidylate kinase
MIVAFEGMDGCGKSSVAKKFASDNNLTLIERPNRDAFGMTADEFRKLCDKFIEYDNPNVLAMFFGFGNVLQTTYGDNLVLDRHILSNYYWNGSEKNNCLYEAMVKLCPSDLVNIILYASPSVRKERIKGRNPNDPDLKVDKAFGFGYDKMIGFAELADMKYLIVDTSNNSLEYVQHYVQELYNVIQTLNEQELAGFCRAHNAPILDKVLQESIEFARERE